MIETAVQIQTIGARAATIASPVAAVGIGNICLFVLTFLVHALLFPSRQDLWPL